MRWLRPLGYEINVDEASTTITTLLVEEVDKEATTFGNYDIAKSKITMELKTALAFRKKNKMEKKLKEKFGEGAEEEEDDDNEEEENAPSKHHLPSPRSRIRPKRRGSRNCRRCQGRRS